MLHYTIIGCFLVASTLCRSFDSRSILRSTNVDTVNLVEFNNRGVTYGRCSYKNDYGEAISVLFEERGTDLRAKTEGHSLSDPISETNKCRDAALSKETPSSFRSDYMQLESNSQLESRFNEFQARQAQNGAYIDSLRPRFFSFTSTSNQISPNAGFLTNLFGNWSAIGLRVMNISLPFISIPIGIQDFPLSIIVPRIHTINIPRPIIGG